MATSLGWACGLPLPTAFIQPCHDLLSRDKPLFVRWRSCFLVLMGDLALVSGVTTALWSMSRRLAFGSYFWWLAHCQCFSERGDGGDVRFLTWPMRGQPASFLIPAMTRAGYPVAYCGDRASLVLARDRSADFPPSDLALILIRCKPQRAFCGSLSFSPRACWGCCWRSF